MNLPPYTSRSIKATALLDETRLLLRAWQPGESSADLRRRVREEGLLGKATAARAVDVVAHAFNQRFLGDNTERATHLRELLARRGAGRWFENVCFLLAARNDVVVREAVTRFIAEERAAGHAAIDIRLMEQFLRDQEAAGRTAKPWSDSVRTSVAQHVLAQLADYGVVSKAGRGGVRRLLGFEPDGVAVAWLAYDLHFDGVSDVGVLEHPDWPVWQMSGRDVRERLLSMAGAGLWELQVAGSVAQFTWGCGSMVEVVDALARRHVR
ncbi:MAG: DUF1819 family protein [Alphaproteobacteria bacterium]|nr:DUF1819 family protein [Alphaproteobacteria bacterium]